MLTERIGQAKITQEILVGFAVVRPVSVYNSLGLTIDSQTLATITVKEEPDITATRVCENNMPKDEVSKEGELTQTVSTIIREEGVILVLPYIKIRKDRPSRVAAATINSLHAAVHTDKAVTFITVEVTTTMTTGRLGTVLNLDSFMVTVLLPSPFFVENCGGRGHENEGITVMVTSDVQVLPVTVRVTIFSQGGEANVVQGTL